MAITEKENVTRITSLLAEAYAARTHNLQKSITLGTEALELSRAVGDKMLTARSLSQLSLFAMIHGEYEDSLKKANEAIKYFEELKDEKGIADAKYNIAGVYYKTDNFHLGLINLIDCITTYRKFKDYHNLSRSHKSLGTIYEYFNDEKNAIQTYEDAIAAAKLAGDANLESNAYNTLSGIYLKQHDLKKAREIIERSVEIKEKTGDVRGLAFSYYGRGKVNLVEGHYDQAERDLSEAIRIHKDMGERLGLGMAYHKISQLYVETGRLDEAKSALTRGLAFSEVYNIVMVKYKCYLLFYQIYKLEGDFVNAIKYLELYHQQKETVINTQTYKVIENYEMLKQMESLEKEARLQLEKAEIVEKKNIAEESARIKQDFLSTMSHEIRTPLNAVITIAALLGEKGDKNEQELIDSLKFASNNLLFIINDILDFTKLDAGKMEVEQRPSNIRTLLDNIRRTYDSMAREKGLQINLNIAADVAESYGMDETKLSQILGNLITNAIKFTQCGHVDIAISNTGEEDGRDKILFEVKDTGVGISEANLESVFESFSQGRSTKTRKEGGTGLGLAIVKKLVELHDSRIRLKSIVGQGSVFSFELLLRRTNGPAEVINRDTQLLNGRKVLLAEDNLINAMVIGKLLANWKMEVDHARNGFEAVSKSQEKPFDYILMDIHMPEMDGYEASQQIRMIDGPNHLTPIYALTADVTAEGNTEYQKLFKGFLHKPIEIDKLYDAFLEK